MGVFYFMMCFLISLLLFESFRNMADCFMSWGRSLDCEDDIRSRKVVSWAHHNNCVELFVYM